LEGFSTQWARLTDAIQQKLDALRVGVEEKLKHIQDDNAKQLDQMRATVDEKLQGTLGKSGWRFLQAGQRSSGAGYTGLGEMRTLASGVGRSQRRC